MLEHDRDLARRVLDALLWLAAFCFACGIFLSATQLLRGIPPTPDVAVGRVTIERASKLRDYAGALLFFLIVPLASILLFRLGAWQDGLFRRALRDDGRRNLASILFVTPFFLAPFLYLTTFKWGWPLLIPLIASQLGPRALILFDRTLWLRALFAPALAPFHGLIVTEALAWILFRYIGVGHRIAHIPTLFLEIVFILFFVVLFWCAFVLVARLASFTSGMPVAVALQRTSIAALPLVALPVMALKFTTGATAISIVMLLVLMTLFVTLRRGDPVDGAGVRAMLAFAILPMLLYCLSYASTAALTQWIDLFHRGESLGPASDYLRGKVPYRDVFVLHGLLEDGQLDAWLFHLFGRNVDIAIARPVILGSLAVPALWYVGMAVFDSIPLAAVVMLLGAVTTVDNEREFWEIFVLALLLGAMRRRSKLLYALSGIAAGVTLFFSLDIGLYSIGGGAIVCGFALCGGGRPRPPAGEAPAATAGNRCAWFFLPGVLLGALPFIIYLAARGALGAFFTTSFVVLPRIIDAVWSLPFPDLADTFRSKNLNLHTLSDFVLFEQFRYILNPLVIGISILVLAARALRRRWEWIDSALFALTAFAVLTQRSALGRADFPHQYFSAFLIGPMIVVLLVLLTRGAARLWQTRDRGAQAFIIVIGLVLAPLLAIALWVPDLVNARLDDTTHYLGRVSGVGFVDPAAVEIRHRIDAVGYWVAQYSKPNQPMFDFSNQPAFYFFCNRPNPTRFYQVPILSPRDLQRETILALERAKPPVVIRRSPQEFDIFDGVDNAIRAQAVAAYLDDHYAFAHTTRGVEIWTRKAVVPRLNLDSYLRRIHTPRLKDLGALGSRTRLLFPSAGSLPGVGGAYWRSDLMLHNPFKETIVLDLRYVAGDFRADRSVALAGGQSIVWPDVVKSFFGAPEGRGVLWIEYRGARPPVARMKTYDVAHQGKASIDAPLSMNEAATAGAQTSDLTIFGIPLAAGGRFNAGVVNVGTIPATARISVRSRTGQQIGRTIEQGIPEDEAFLLNDLEGRLGVHLDETTSVHVTVVAGTCVAFGTVIDASGGTDFIAALPSQP